MFINKKVKFDAKDLSLVFFSILFSCIAAWYFQIIFKYTSEKNLVVNLVTLGFLALTILFLLRNMNKYLIYKNQKISEEKTQFIVRCRVMVLRDGKLLVVKHSPQAKFYALPGGHMEAGETPLACIVREIEEELGVKMSNRELKYVYKWNMSKDQNRKIESLEFFFLVQDNGEFENFEHNKRTHGFEIVDFKWIERGEEIVLLPEVIAREFKEHGFRFEGVRFLGE